MSIKKIFNLVSDVAQIVLIILLLSIAVLGFGAKIPFLAERGLNFFAVVSGSMEPAIPVGAVIKAGQYNLENLQKGDIITYHLGGGEGGRAAIVTHRIFEIAKKEETQIIGEGDEQSEKQIISYEFTTKGDANQREDSYTVGADQIIGLYEWHLPYLGYVTNFAQSSTGFILLVIVPAVILIVWESVSLVLHFKQVGSQKDKQELAKLKAKLAKAEENKDKKNKK